MAADILQMTSDRNTPIDNSTGSPVALKNQNKDDDMCGHVTNINKEQDMDSRSEQSKEIENNNSSLDLSLDDSDSGKMGNGILSQFSNYSEKETCNNDNSDIDDDGLVDNDDNVSNGSEIGMAKSPVSSTAQISDRNSYDIKSQYHSIQQLSLPAVGHTANPASFGQAFNTPNLPISSAYDFSFASLYEKNRRNNLDSKQGILGGDSVYFLRNLINSNHSNNVFDGYNNDMSRQDQGSPLALCNNRHRDTKAERKMEEDDQDKPVDMTGFFGSQKESYEDSLLRTPSNLSVSSRADLSDDEDDGCDVLRQNKRRRFDKEMDDGSDLDVESFIQDDSASMSDDQGSCDDIVEAKRARMEAIVNNMRVSPNERSISNNAAVKTEMMDGSRRARRKQQAPRQHDISSSSLDMDNVGDGSEVSDKGDLQQELRYVRDQLAEMESKYCQLLEKSDKNENKDQSILDCRRIVADQKKDLSHFVQESARDLVNRQLSQRWLALMGDINCNGKSFEKSNPSIGDASLDVQNLAEMLRSEITSSVGSLVDEIVKNFVKKHKLEKEGIKEEQNSSPRRRLSSDGGDSSEDDLNESKEFCNKPASHIKEEEKVTRNFPCKSQIPSSMFLPQTFPPSMAQILAGFSEYSMMNRFGYLQKNLGKPVERFPPYLDQQIQKSSFNLPRPGGVPLFPSNPFFPGAGLTTPTAPSLFQREPEQTEALPLVVNSAPAKKKRTKVTDTRLSPRAARAMLQESNPAHPGRQDHLESTPGDQAINDPSILTSNDFSVHNRHLQGHYSSQTPQSLLPASLPTSVAVPNPSLQHSDILQAIYSRHHLQSRPQQLDFTPKHPQDTLGKTSSRSSTPGEVASLSGGERGKKFGGGVESYRTRDQLIGAEFSSDLTSYDEHALITLTPVHLRKAKLMFFYVRYPSSSVIKTFFPDVKFNKNNTAQLIKWFSNFRTKLEGSKEITQEFYYIQMEKYARQAISDGTKSSSEIIVTLDSEIYRVLVLHYNRNNQIEVPDNFRTTVQATLREFFKSIQAERDQEPSWKKAIYKIIARLDDNVPEYFKSTNWMEQLIDG